MVHLIGWGVLAALAFTFSWFFTSDRLLQSVRDREPKQRAEFVRTMRSPLRGAASGVMAAVAVIWAVQVGFRGDWRAIFYAIIAVVFGATAIRLRRGARRMVAALEGEAPDDWLEDERARRTRRWALLMAACIGASFIFQALLGDPEDMPVWAAAVYVVLVFAGVIFAGCALFAMTWAPTRSSPAKRSGGDGLGEEVGEA